MSKFGAHISSGPRTGIGEAFQQCTDAGSPVAVIVALDQNVWEDITRYSPQTVLCFRTQIDGNPNPPGIWQGDPIASADAWYDLRRPIWLQNPAHYYIPCNEMDAATFEHFDWQNAFDLRMMQRADADGMKLGIGVHSTGTPSDFSLAVDQDLFEAKKKALADYRALYGETMAYTPKATEQMLQAFDLPRFRKWDHLIPSLQYAKAHGHVLILHEYGFDTTLPLSTPHHALRYRSVLDYLAQFNADPKVIVGEGWDFNGYSGGGETELAGVEWYDSQVIDDPRVIGFAAYQLGGAENWRSLIPAWANHVASHPTLVSPPQPSADEFEVTDVQVDGVSIGVQMTGSVVMTADHKLELFQRPKPVIHSLTVVETPSGGLRFEPRSGTHMHGEVVEWQIVKA